MLLTFSTQCLYKNSRRNNMLKSAINFLTLIALFTLLSACSETKQTVKAVGDTTVNVTKDVVNGTINTVDAIVP